MTCNDNNFVISGVLSKQSLKTIVDRSQKEKKIDDPSHDTAFTIVILRRVLVNRTIFLEPMVHL